MTDAFCHGMMPTLIENLHHDPRPCCTREQAARLLEALRVEYQSLPPELRHHVKSVISKVASVHCSMELSEEK